MFVIALIASAILLGLVAWLVYLEKRPILSVYGLALLFSLHPVVSCMVLPPVLVQAALIGIARTATLGRSWRPRTFLWLSLIGTVSAYGITTTLAILETNALREKYPIISMEETLPAPRRAIQVSEDSQWNLRHVESQLEPPGYVNSHIRLQELRMEGFKTLHEQTVSNFVRSQGFGVGRLRLAGSPDPDVPMRMAAPVLQPGERPEPILSEGELETPPPPEKDSKLLWLHSESTLDFVNPEGFGYVKDRRHVVGFQPHYFSKVPESAPWQLQTLELVGLVVHERPMAYVSDQLPRMDKLKKAPTRPLDVFEEMGLAALKQGEELFVRDVGSVRRMLGAIRSARQCVGCHGGERGDLLGAFAYTLKRAVP
jgi:hypothetical protein